MPDSTCTPIVGWKLLCCIFGNGLIENFASYLLKANMMESLTDELNLGLDSATYINLLWNVVTIFTPLLAAFIADTYAGRAKTIAYTSISSMVGMLILTWTVWSKDMHPPTCTLCQRYVIGHCVEAIQSQVGVLLFSLALLAIGSGGIRAWTTPFGTAQFDATTMEGERARDVFLNRYFVASTIVSVANPLIVHFTSFSLDSRKLFGIYAACMFCSMVTVSSGTEYYKFVEPEGINIIYRIARVLVAAYKKRKLELPTGGDQIVYDPMEEAERDRLPRTNQFRCLDKAAMIIEGDLEADGVSRSRWRLCSVQQVEEVKHFIRIVPIWAIGTISIVFMSQQDSYTPDQAESMDYHLTPKFVIPPPLIGVVPVVATAVWLSIHDRFLVPAAKKLTNNERGITLLQRMGIGMVISVPPMITAGAVEKRRRDSALSNTQDYEIGKDIIHVVVSS